MLYAFLGILSLSVVCDSSFVDSMIFVQRLQSRTHFSVCGERPVRIKSAATLIRSEKFPVRVKMRISGSSHGITDEDSSFADKFEPVVVKNGEEPLLSIIPDSYSGDTLGLHNVIIKPSFAWGEGAHPSTYMCLQFICRAIGTRFQNASMLDYGTGSGVLAIAAKKIGAGRVVGIDKDDEIIQCAQENVALNFGACHNAIEFVHGRDVVTGTNGLFLGGSSSSSQFDLVVANMLPAALVRMAPTIASAVREDSGVVALCGLRRDQVADVVAAYEGNGVRVEEENCMIGSAPGTERASRSVVSTNSFLSQDCRQWNGYFSEGSCHDEQPLRHGHGSIIFRMPQ